MAVQKACNEVNSIPAVFTSGMPTLGMMKKTYGYDFTQAYLEGWIVNVKDFFSISNSIKEQTIGETAMIVLDTYPYLTLADINLVFKRAKMGFFGELYNRLDGQIILGWFKTYNEERLDAAADESIKNASVFKSDPYERTSDKQNSSDHNFRLENLKSLFGKKKT